MLLALTLYAQGKTKLALSTLGPILAQAEPEGYLRLFADEGEAMAHLLALIAPFTTASPDYLQRIQAAIDAAWQAQPDVSTQAATQAEPRSIPSDPPLRQSRPGQRHAIVVGRRTTKVCVLTCACYLLDWRRPDERR
jgi:LuxR family maltose regulon positive regulatory protein